MDSYYERGALSFFVGLAPVCSRYLSGVFFPVSEIKNNRHTLCVASVCCADALFGAGALEWDFERTCELQMIRLQTQLQMFGFCCRR